MAVGDNRIGTEQTSNRQTPWEESSLKGDFYFVPAALAPVVTAVPTKPANPQAPAPSTSEAERVWNQIKTTKNIRVLEVYAEQFKGTVYAALASERIDELKKTRVAIGRVPKLPSIGDTLNRAYPVNADTHYM